MSQNHSVASQKYSPTGNQQNTPQVPVGIDHADGNTVSSEGNQALKDAVEQLHPKDMARNLDPKQPDQAPSELQQSAPFAGYATGKVPDTAKPSQTKAS